MHQDCLVRWIEGRRLRYRLDSAYTGRCLIDALVLLDVMCDMNARAEQSSTLLRSRQQAATAKTHRGCDWLCPPCPALRETDTGLVMCDYVLFLSRQ
jgi:hypothetical protein